MRLRSLTKHIRDQNWFAVALDFFIVVVGILIALQITNWNEARKAASDERAIIAQLKTDFKTLEDQLEERVARSERLMKQTMELVKLIQLGEEPKDKDYVKTLIFAAGSISFREAPPASYSELLASGKLSELSDSDLRKALIKYGQVHAKWDYADGFVPAQRSEDSKFVQALSYNMDQDMNNLTSGIIRSYDWAKLKEAEVSISTIRQNHYVQFFRHQQDLAAVRIMLVELEKQ